MMVVRYRQIRNTSATRIIFAMGLPMLFVLAANLWLHTSFLYILAVVMFLAALFISFAMLALKLACFQTESAQK